MTGGLRACAPSEEGGGGSPLWGTGAWAAVGATPNGRGKLLLVLGMTGAVVPLLTSAGRASLPEPQGRIRVEQMSGGDPPPAGPNPPPPRPPTPLLPCQFS